MAAKKSAKKKTSRRTRAAKGRSDRSSVSSLDSDVAQEGEEFGVQRTGRMIMTFADSTAVEMKSTLASLRDRASVSNVCHVADFGEAFDISQSESADAVVFDGLGIAVMQVDSDRMASVSEFGAQSAAPVVVEPEYMNFAFDLDSESGLDGDVDDVAVDAGQQDAGFAASPAYLRGYAAGVQQLTESLGDLGQFGGPDASYAPSRHEVTESRTLTWGLRATRAQESRFTGQGIRVAVLDTGMDLRHPDFQGRSMVSQSFIQGESAQDGNGHGTHCIGTACGSKRPGVGPRYGVATEADIYAGKVLSNAGSGGDGSILAGIDWAIRNHCSVISMSLGRRVQPGEQPMRAYEAAGRAALRAGSLIIAAAGNDSSRPHHLVPVSSPANSSTIAAIAAINSRSQMARFSNAGLNPGGGEINFAGPGSDVHSSWPMPVRLRSISGTSMATPHASGIAALLAEEDQSARGVELYKALRRRVRRLPHSRRDVGNGLIQAI